MISIAMTKHLSQLGPRRSLMETIQLRYRFLVSFKNMTLTLCPKLRLRSRELRSQEPSMVEPRSVLKFLKVGLLQLCQPIHPSAQLAKSRTRRSLVACLVLKDTLIHLKVAIARNALSSHTQMEQAVRFTTK